jgi:hypothetical protein
MKVYTNSPINISIEDHDNIEEIFETYIYTQNGIYKKYKKHFFLCECDLGIAKTSQVKNGHHEYLIEENELKINKQKMLTSIPYQCYFVNRFVRKCVFSNNVVFVKELDNDYFESFYFVVDTFEQLKDIGLYIE